MCAKNQASRERYIRVNKMTRRGKKFAVLSPALLRNLIDLIFESIESVGCGNTIKARDMS